MNSIHIKVDADGDEGAYGGMRIIEVGKSVKRSMMRMGTNLNSSSGDSLGDSSGSDDTKKDGEARFGSVVLERARS